MILQRAEICDEQDFGTNITLMSDLRAENMEVEADYVRSCSEDGNILEGLKREEEEELSSITHPEEGIFSNLVQFLEESSKCKISQKKITRKEDGTTEDDFLQKVKPTPQDVLLGSTAALSLASTIATGHDDEISTKATHDETEMKCKVWIWDEIDSARHTSECLFNSQMLPSGALQFSSAVEEKERSFQSLVAKVRALREKLSEKENIVASLEKTLNKSISSHSSIIMKQAIHWNDILRKQDLEYEQRFKGQQALVEQMRQECADITLKIHGLRQHHKNVVSPTKAQQCLDKIKMEFEKAQKDKHKLEESRLAKFVDSKVEDIKRSVAKAMEPKLTKLLNQNKRELQHLKQTIEHDVSDFKKRLEADLAERFKNEHKSFFDNVLENDPDVRKFECDQQKYIMDYSLQRMANLQEEQNFFKQEMEQERISFEEQCKALRHTNGITEKTEETEEEEIFKRASLDHQTKMEQLWSEQKENIQSKRDEISRQGADWRKYRESILRSQYSTKKQEITEEFESKSLKEIALIESRLESEKVENQRKTRQEQEEEIHRCVSDHQRKMSRVNNETEEYMEQLVHLSRFANDHISEMKRLESCITKEAIALNEVGSRVDSIKGRVLRSFNDSSSVRKLRCELSHQEESMEEDLKGHRTKLEKLVLHLNAAIHAHNEEVQQLGYKHQNEIEVIQDKVQVLLNMKNSELDAKRETLDKLKEAYVLKEQELDALRQKYLTKVD